MALTILVIIAAIYLDTYRIRYQEKRDSFREVIAGLWFEPYKDRYPMGTMTGLEWECSNDSVFNDFKEGYLIHRLWADASEPNSYIRANRDDEGLRIQCNRRGYGADVTIQPNDNRPRITGERNELLLNIENVCDQPVAVRLRVVDERGTQWAWAFERKETEKYFGTKIALDYYQKDRNDTPLTIYPDGNAVILSFPLERERWEVFPHDGNATMPSRGRFKVIQYVVIEIGSPHPEEKKKPGEHRRFLADADDISINIRDIRMQ